MIMIRIRTYRRLTDGSHHRTTPCTRFRSAAITARSWRTPARCRGRSTPGMSRPLSTNHSTDPHVPPHRSIAAAGFARHGTPGDARRDCRRRTSRSSQLVGHDRSGDATANGRCRPDHSGVRRAVARRNAGPSIFPSLAASLHAHCGSREGRRAERRTVIDGARREAGPAGRSIGHWRGAGGPRGSLVVQPAGNP